MLHVKKLPFRRWKLRQWIDFLFQTGNIQSEKVDASHDPSPLAANRGTNLANLSKTLMSLPVEENELI